MSLLLTKTQHSEAAEEAARFLRLIRNPRYARYVTYQHLAGHLEDMAIACDELDRRDEFYGLAGQARLVSLRLARQAGIL